MRELRYPLARYFAVEGIDAPLTTLVRRLRIDRARLTEEFSSRDDLVRAVYDCRS